jgi:hypothetical protein
MESLLLSCKTVHRQWFRAFGLLVVIGLITKACDDDTRNLLLFGKPLSSAAVATESAG